MLFTVSLVVALVGSGRFYGAAGQSCSFTLQTDLDPAKEPLVLEASGTSSTLEIPYPDVVSGKGVVTVADGSNLLLACLGSKNYVKGSGASIDTLTCTKGSLLNGKSKATKTSNSCTKVYAESSLKVLDESCGSGDNTGTKLQLGFDVSDESSWVSLVDVCHNISTSTTLYSSHQVYGHSLAGAIKSSIRRSFSRGPKDVFPKVNPDSCYVRKGQTKAFDKILGSGGASKYISNTNFLARGHLAPDADFIYNSGQLLTYFYVNVAPQWQPFNAGNWLSIESTVRSLGTKSDETLNVHTGTYGILKLTNDDGAERNMYLDATNKLIPVPEVYWKLVQNPETKACTVAVGHNNVYLTSAPEAICSTVTPNGWPTLTNLAKGYTYYCDYASFKNVVTYAPSIECTDLFEFS